MRNKVLIDSLKIYIENYGCSANYNNGEIIAGILKEAGHEILEKAEESRAQIIILNTCTVKEPTEKKILKRIKNISKNKRLIVAGCMPEVQADEIRKARKDVSLLGLGDIKKINELVEKLKQGKNQNYIGGNKETKLLLPRIRKNPVIEIVQISEGCSQNCSYCIVRLAKGSLVSYPADKVVEEIKQSVKQGCREIWITSQDNAAYGSVPNEGQQQKGKTLTIKEAKSERGMSLTGTSGASKKALGVLQLLTRASEASEVWDRAPVYENNLSNLLDKIASIEGDFMVRIGMMNPAHVLPIKKELIRIYKHKKIFKFLHIPVQSGNDRILKLMNRKYSAAEFRKIISDFRKEIPDITISTDIICGFPTETEKEFQDSLKLIREIKPDVVNVSRFGARPGTVAAKMKQIHGNETKKRSQEMTGLCRNLIENNMKKWVGTKQKILIDEFGKKKGQFVGRTTNYLPVVATGKFKLGQTINARITDAKEHYLVGE